ncbi:MAG: hypothetical protein Q9223_005448, partial [Gallowayella weberi]
MIPNPRPHPSHLPFESNPGHHIKNASYPLIPRQGRLIPLRTKAEVNNSSPQTTTAYVVKIPQKSADEILKILETEIPLHPPTSSLQATQWSSKYWPTVYRKHNPFGPQPSVISKAEADLQATAGFCMSLALQAGSQSEEKGLGINVGVVIVEKGDVVAAVAGDGRWVGERCGREGGGDEEGDYGAGNSNGNPMAHAVMRAIGMVARKRRELLLPPFPHGTQGAAMNSSQPKPSTAAAAEEIQDDYYFTDTPLTGLEKDFHERESLKA